MINKTEEIAEYIVKNLIFVLLFIVFCYYGITHILLPKIQDFKSKQENYKQQQFFEAKLQEKNKEQQLHIQTKQEENKTLLLSLQNNIDSAKLHSIAQEFFEVEKVSEIQSKKNEIFEEIDFQIKGKSNGVKAIFDFFKKVSQTIPNAAFSLPFELSKKDPLMNTLDIRIYLKTTKLLSKKS